VFLNFERTQSGGRRSTHGFQTPALLQKPENSPKAPGVLQKCALFAPLQFAIEMTSRVTRDFIEGDRVFVMWGRFPTCLFYRWGQPQ
jgi:hypothetical protein